MNEFWLIDEKALNSIEVLMTRGHTMSVAEQEAFKKTLAFDDQGRPSNMSVSGDRAHISINGVLTDTPNWMYAFFGSGNTTYPDIQAAIANANADINIKEIDAFIDSPGGQASTEWIATIEAFKNSEKPINVHVGNEASSAAYGLASQGKTITAKNSFSTFGSIGVVQTMRKKGDTIEIVSQNAPNKRPDPETEEGKREVLSVINDMESEFIGHVAEGRGVSEQTVKNDFGKGGVMVAKKALANNMIDSIASDNSKQSVNNNNTNTVASGGEKPTTEEGLMDLATLKASHPEVYALALNEGKIQGKADELDRVSAHAIMGESSGDMTTAITAIKNGTEMTATLQATYMAAGMNRTDAQTRKNADTSAAAALDNSAAPEASGGKDMEDQVGELVAQNSGLTVEDK